MALKGTRTIKQGKLSWVDIQDPPLKVLLNYKEKYGFHELDIEDCLSENQRSKIDEYEDYLFIILHIPFYDKRRHRVVSEEVNIFIKNNVIVTIHNGVLKPLLQLFEGANESKAERQKVMGHGSGFLLYEIIDQLYSSGFPILDIMERDVNNLERDVFSMMTQHDMLKDILMIKKNIITFRRIIAPQRAVIAQLEHKNQKFMLERLEIYFDDVVDKIEKMWNNLENMREIIETLHETNETIISHTTNNVIKILTIFSVTMLPLTFLTGLYGMNVQLPLAEKQHVFLLITGIMVTVVISMIGFFKYKRWI
ncbi:magnesium transporter CorA family protein [Patescibacteria group bacterium]|nr:magnesium transporter CorA family protein [Patescibacteria group bacterium]